MEDQDPAVGQRHLGLPAGLATDQDGSRHGDGGPQGGRADRRLPQHHPAVRRRDADQLGELPAGAQPRGRRPQRRRGEFSIRSALSRRTRIVRERQLLDLDQRPLHGDRLHRPRHPENNCDRRSGPERFVETVLAHSGAGDFELRRECLDRALPRYADANCANRFLIRSRCGWAAGSRVYPASRMAKDTEKLIRQLSLISYLMAQGRPTSALEIKREVEGYSDMNDDAFARRFYADRAELDALGITLQVEKPGESLQGYESGLYSLPPENYYLPEIRFLDDELAALQTALQLLDGEFAYAEPLRLALQQVSWGRPSPLTAPEESSVEVR